MEIKTKYNIGDRVFSADTIFSDTQVKCPDCLGTKSWKIIFADKHEEEIMCQTCRRGYERANGFVIFKEYQPEVKELTIGNIRYNDDGDNKFSYVCNETGIGSCRVYYDKDIFSNKEDAQKRAEEKYLEQQKTIAKNNFSKRFGGTEELARALEMFGYSRSEKLRKIREFRKWAELPLK